MKVLFLVLIALACVGTLSRGHHSAPAHVAHHAAPRVHHVDHEEHHTAVHHITPVVHHTDPEVHHTKVHHNAPEAHRNESKVHHTAVHHNASEAHHSPSKTHQHAVHHPTLVTHEGVDISFYSGAPEQSAFNCLRENGKEFIIMQIWEGGYGINKDFEANYAKAKAAGFKIIDAYAFACNNCVGNKADNICSSIKNNLPSGFDGRVWLDIEDCTGCWGGSDEERLHFLEDVATTCKGQGLEMGVYSGSGSWSSVFSTSAFNGGKLTYFPLWFSWYDGSASINYGGDEFGGWKIARMKQYAGTTLLCGLHVDLDYI